MTLRHGDLNNLVDDILEIDSFKSKMGNEEDVITISISVKNKPASDDLVAFLEKGYSFILDAEATPGEQSDGWYKVFVEIDRSRTAVDDIMDVIDGLHRLTNVEKFRFRYYKSFRSVDLTREELEDIVPLTAEDYLRIQQAVQMDNYTNFFDKSFVESVYMDHDQLVINKKWADPVAFNFVDFGDADEVRGSINESFNINAYPEIMFLTKYIGDYNISKYGSKLTFENQGKTLVVERHVV